MDLQELITRGRFLFSQAPVRQSVFQLVNGKRTASDIAKTLRRQETNVHRDLKLLNDGELIRPRTGDDGQPIRLRGFTVYEKTALARTVPAKYFQGPAKLLRRKDRESASSKKSREKRPGALSVPTEAELLDICRDGEDQIHEFKASGADVRKITREIGAMLNTRQGGIVLYGVSDDGTIQGSDLSRQKLDQPLQNSLKNTISPAAVVTLKSVSVMGSEVLVIVVPPWNRRDVYQYDERVLVRKGTNVFAAKPEELRKLHKGEYII